MTPPADLLDAVVASWRAISDVVDEMNSDETRIAAYEDSPPSQTSLVDWVHKVSRPSITVAYGGLNVAGALDDRGKDQHTINAYVWCRDGSSYLTLLNLLVNGVVVDLPWRHSEIHEDCYPVGGALKIVRVVDTKGEPDFFQLSFLLVDTNG